MACDDKPSREFRSDCGASPSVYALADVGAFTELRQVLQLSGIDATDPFGRVTDVTVDSRGNIYTLDAMNQRVTIHDHEGEFLHTFGQRGEGPAEFEDPTVLALSPPDTVKVFDPILWRLTMFSSSGNLLFTITPPAEARFGQVDEVTFGPDGILFKLGYKDFQKSLEGALGGKTHGVVRGRNTLQYWAGPGDQWHDMLEVSGLEVYANLSQGLIRDVPFARRAMWEPTGGGLWYADNAQFAVARYSVDGEFMCGIETKLGAVKVSSEERRSYYSAADLENDSRFSSDEIARIREGRRDVPMPETKPVIQDLLVSDDGELWIQVLVVGEEKPESRWYVFSDSAAPKAIIKLPDSLTPLYIKSNKIYGREVDGLGVQRLGVYEYH